MTTAVPPLVAEYAFQQEDGQGKDHKPEGGFHMAHPRAAFRQQAIAKHGHKDQRQAHAQRVKVQRAAAQPQITALGDIQQNGA